MPDMQGGVECTDAPCLKLSSNKVNSTHITAERRGEQMGEMGTRVSTETPRKQLITAQKQNLEKQMYPD